MKIEAISVETPSLRLTNEDILQKISTASKGIPNSLRKVISRFLRITGSKERFWLNEGETPLDVTLRACKKVLSEVDCSSVDMLIVASVYGEMIEPSTASLLAYKLGLASSRAIDLKIACDGWMAALDTIAYPAITSGRAKRVLLVNMEFGTAPLFGTYPDLFMISSHDQLEWRFPIFTVGQVATATLLSQSETRWSFTNTTRNDLFDLCTMTAKWSRSWNSISPKVGKDGPGVFTSFGGELTKQGIPLAVEEFRKSGIHAGDVDMLFHHSSSEKDWKEISRLIGLSGKNYCIHGRLGNCVSASVPAAMGLALQEGKLVRGSRVAVLTASAGMTFSTAQFTF